MTFREHFPTFFRNARIAAVVTVIVYCVLATVFSVGVSSDRENCVTQNAGRTSNYTNARSTASENRELARQEHDPEIAAIYRRIAARQDVRADGILSTSAQTGHQVSSDQPAIDCAAAYPQVLPWFSQ